MEKANKLNLFKTENIMKMICFLIIIAIISLDQWFKLLAAKYLSNIPTKPIIKDVFHLTYVENRGAAFGMLSGKNILLIVLTSIILIGLILSIIFYKFNSKIIPIAVSLFVGGGIGNLIDRVSKNYVIDYLDFRIINFAVFNFADCCIVVATILLILAVLLPNKKKITE